MNYLIQFEMQCSSRHSIFREMITLTLDTCSEMCEINSAHQRLEINLVGMSFQSNRAAARNQEYLISRIFSQHNQCILWMCDDGDSKIIIKE